MQTYRLWEATNKDKLTSSEHMRASGNFQPTFLGNLMVTRVAGTLTP